ncbi:MAG: LEA type 2 family protein [Planctomycetes bacterium]|nr:LEA type 2 family protein [Planctomycetota bacterium]
MSTTSACTERFTRTVALATLGMVLATAGGCAQMQDLLRLNQPSAKIANVALKDVGLEDATLVFDVQVTNPYAAALPLANLDYALASGGKSFLSGKADLQGSVPAKGSKVVSLPAQVKYMDLLRVLGSVRPGAVVPYEAELGLSVDAPSVGPLRLPLTRQGKLPVPAPPTVSVSEIAWTDLSLDQAAGIVRLNVVNNNDFPLDLSRMNYALSLAGSQVAAATMDKASHFAAKGGQTTLDIPVTFVPKQLGVSVFRMLSGQGAGYKFNGVMDLATEFGPMRLPVEKIGQTLFKR